MLDSNPVLTREVRTGFRGRRAFVARTLFVAVLALVVVATWGTALMDISGGVKGAAVDIRAIPGLGRQLFTSFGLALLVLLLAILPGYAGAAISGEREKQTLDSTLCTRLKPRHIVTGKLAACVLLALALLLSSLPAMGAVFLLGGVSPLEVALLFVILFATALFVSALSLYVSALSRRTYAAVMLTYGLILGLHFALVPGLKVGTHALLHQGLRVVPDSWKGHGYSARIRASLSLANPYSALQSIFVGAEAAPPRPEPSGGARTTPPARAVPAPPSPPLSGPYGPGRPGVYDGVRPSGSEDRVDAPPSPSRGLAALVGGPERARFALRHLQSPLALVLLTALLVILASRRLGRAEALARRGLFDRTLRWLVTQQERRRPAARPIRPRGRAWTWLANRISNPVFARDLRGRMLGRFGLLTKSACVGLLATAAISLAAPSLMIFPESTVKAMLLCVAVMPVLGGILAATSIAVEKEQQTFEMILATPMRPRAIIAGKLAGAFYRVQPLILLGLPIALLAVYVGTLTWHSAAWMLALMELFALAACAVGVLASLLAHRASRAVSSTLLIIGFVLVGPFIAKQLGLTRIFVTGQQSRGSTWLGPGPLAWVFDAFLRPDVAARGGEWAAGLALGVTVLALALALLLFRRAARQLVEQG